jgi:hypothetical protein
LPRCLQYALNDLFEHNPEEMAATYDALNDFPQRTSMRRADKEEKEEEEEETSSDGRFMYNPYIYKYQNHKRRKRK